MVVQNSASALDHPVILRNQRDLINHSMQNDSSEVQETEFSFREKHKESQRAGESLQKFSPDQANDKSMNEQSFIYTENSGAKMKHHESPVRRDRSPVMKSFFKIKQTADSEILPSRGIP